MNIPDSWVLLDLGNGLVKVLAGWSGGYLDGDSWKINSGITKVDEHKDHYLIMGVSESIYKCRKGSYGLRMSIAMIYNQIKNKYPQVKLIDEDEVNNVLGQFKT